MLIQFCTVSAEVRSTYRGILMEFQNLTSFGDPIVGRSQYSYQIVCSKLQRVEVFCRCPLLLSNLPTLRLRKNVNRITDLRSKISFAVKMRERKFNTASILKIQRVNVFSVWHIEIGSWDGIVLGMTTDLNCFLKLFIQRLPMSQRLPFIFGKRMDRQK